MSPALQTFHSPDSKQASDFRNTCRADGFKAVFRSYKFKLLPILHYDWILYLRNCLVGQNMRIIEAKIVPSTVHQGSHVRGLSMSVFQVT